MKKFLIYWSIILLALTGADYWMSYYGSKATSLFHGWFSFMVFGIAILCIMLPSLLIGFILTRPNNSQNPSDSQNFSNTTKTILVIIVLLAALFITRSIFFR